VAKTKTQTYHLGKAARKLLLLTARGRWDKCQSDAALRLSHQVIDWDVFCDVAIRSFGVCLAYRLLRTLPTGAVPQKAMTRMQQASRFLSMRSLQFEAAQLNFMNACLEPLGVRHAFFKGASLAHRYHEAPAARPSRDVDVLIDPAKTFAVLSSARQLGYAPVNPIEPGDQGLTRWIKEDTVYGMIAPSGVLIEIHQSLDHGDGVLDPEQMLARAETFDFRGRSLSVLRTSDLFVYMCMHHTRHFWSHLHWYADLDAITSHSLFDLDEVLEVAGSVRLVPTVEACLALNEFARSGDWPDEFSNEGNASQAILARSVECLEGGPEREVELRAIRLSPDRAFAWQSSLSERVYLLLRKQFRRFISVARRMNSAFGWGKNPQVDSRERGRDKA